MADKARTLAAHFGPEVAEKYKDQILVEDIFPYHASDMISSGSTDVGDVSYITPTAQFTTACAPIPVSAHTWQSCSCYGTSVGTKGMIRAGEAMALTGYDLFTDKKDVIEKAKEELKADLDGATYTPTPR